MTVAAIVQARMGSTRLPGMLARYLGAAQSVGADAILRVTSDCPLIDPDICAALLALRSKESADYAANNMPPSYPHGLDCEAFTFVALEEAAGEASTREDREHVTPLDSPGTAFATSQFA